MNILSGLTPSTNGDCLIFGLSVRSKVNKLKTIMGVCPQHDILYSELTALEHIELYCGLKGVPKLKWRELADDRLSWVSLLNEKNNLVNTFSGGFDLFYFRMKRRLSLVISTIGGI